MEWMRNVGGPVLLFKCWDGLAACSYIAEDEQVWETEDVGMAMKGRGRDRGIYCKLGCTMAGVRGVTDFSTFSNEKPAQIDAHMYMYVHVHTHTHICIVPL